MSDYWGYHLILDAAGCDHDSITSRENVHDFVKQLVTDIDMVAYGEPQIVHFGSGNKEGFTLVQLIETSNICAHFVNEHGHMYLDVFSCKTFEPQTVIDVAQKYFKFEKFNTAFLQRQAPTE
jgi:S-adenosylmethionine/arginine decarboxylase-like enzyme